jgi:2-polyprenyl-3-methyl-5-hydroxy-6-metoxy-1,4-benzoquinol methylase
MRQEDIWDADAAARYDTPGTGMFAPEVLQPAVDRLAELAGGGAALEFAVGTGRVAVPLAERGVPVTGIELSRPMVERLREKADEARHGAGSWPDRRSRRRSGLRQQGPAVWLALPGTMYRQ